MTRNYTGTYAVVDRDANRDQFAFTSVFSWQQAGQTMVATTYMVLGSDGKSLKVVNTDPQVAGAPGFILAFTADKK
jgi:hypothetical protein